MTHVSGEELCTCSGGGYVISAGQGLSTKTGLRDFCIVICDEQKYVNIVFCEADKEGKGIRATVCGFRLVF